MPADKSKIYISPPQSSNSLADQIWGVYDRCPRNTKSRAMQRLLEGGIALENLGILDAVIALALSEPIAPQGDAQNKQTAALVLGRLMDKGAVVNAAPVASEAEKPMSQAENEVLNTSSTVSLDRTGQSEISSDPGSIGTANTEVSGLEARKSRKRAVAIGSLMSLKGDEQ
ncbi:hypothetical protein [uncultured Amphritea sp.]|uniref:hypothetical protein n=1 Tax=uncultured Amphritea sp. TaxID=981605 RepID=UPI0026329CC0|nr:hypothetical protein [uncultured Amphritea sp.]